MAGDTSLQERLREHAKAFDGLLSLIPAKMYYGNGEDTTEQWKKKKKTKAEKKAARLANLDPDNELNKSVKEIMEERARNKRKLEEAQEGDDEDAHGGSDSDGGPGDVIAGIAREKPGEGLKKASEKANKKQKLSSDDNTEPAAEADDKGAGETEESKLSAKQERKLLRKQQKLEKKAERKKAKSQPASSSTPTATPQKKSETSQQADEEDAAVVDDAAAPELENKEAAAGEDEDAEADGEGLQAADFSKLAAEEDAPGSGSTSGDGSSHGTPQSPTFDPVPQAKSASVECESTSTSISSTVPPAEKPRHIKVPADTTALRARLAARIEALRAARKADGDGKPVRTRQELIEVRRQKQAERKAHKKELRRQAKLEEERKREEALASARNSPGSVMSPMLADEDVDESRSTNHFSFGRIAFADGSQMSHDLSYVKEGGAKRGPAASDAKGHLARLEAQKKRLATMDEDKRRDVLEKETWLAARRKAEGDKVRDDEALLKKAVKRKEKAKKRSEREWKERTQGVEDAQRQRQRKREENIRKRKEDKLLGKAKKKGGGSAAKVKRGRPGFEGAFARRK